MKMQRRTGVNGVRENHKESVVNKGGTAGFSVPVFGEENPALFCYRGK